MLMSESAIRVENLGKRYQIGRQHTASISDRIKHLLHKNPKQNQGDFWALKDVSFDIKKGEAVGIVGKNGAGKSTLLKVLSRITHPTEGRFEMNGRVSSLLEVGTGFHPELSGRENIFLNGTILGMSRQEIKSKFEEIVAFSGVSKFLDTPVKHYSSGMYVRLAFSVAAHLEPEILIIDEVLAVGDAEFQKKCLGKMDEVAKQGRTVIFVSHNMSAVQQLCSKALLIQSGRVTGNGTTNEVIESYLHQNAVSDSNDLTLIDQRSGNGEVQFTKIEFLDASGQVSETGTSGKPFTIRLYFHVQKPQRHCRASIAVSNKGKTLFLMSSENSIEHELDISKDGRFDFSIANLPLDIGQYNLTLYLESSGGIQDLIQNAFELRVEQGNFFTTGKSSPRGWEGSVVLVEHFCKLS